LTTARASLPTRCEQRVIVGMKIDATSYEHAAAFICRRAHEGTPGYVCVSTVHMVMEAVDDAAYRGVVNRAALVTPDGMPLVWGLRRLGVAGATRVYGPTLTPLLCACAAREGLPIALYGGAPEVLPALCDTLQERFPGLEIVYAESPPFRPPSPEEDALTCERIRASGARIILVGLGCPKQERWMAAHEGVFEATMVGVGAAFDFLAGQKRQAPAWIQNAGLEWLFRLGTEPRRLWKRYLKHNPRFVVRFALQLARGRQRENEEPGATADRVP